jgi:hypothetical protein
MRYQCKWCCVLVTLCHDMSTPVPNNSLDVCLCFSPPIERAWSGASDTNPNHESTRMHLMEPLHTSLSMGLMKMSGRMNQVGAEDVEWSCRIVSSVT